MSEERYYAREFLNKPGYHGVAHALAKVELDGDGDLCADLLLADCNRQITLDFNIWSSHSLDDIANVAHKSRTLRRIVNEFCDAVDESVRQRRKELRAVGS